MRRKDREVKSMEKMLEILDACDCCRIGLIDEFCPYILPLNFGYEEKDGELILYFHGATEGKKIDLIKEQNIAAFEMDRKHELVVGDSACQYSYRYQSIMGKGKIYLVTESIEKIHALKIIMKHYAKNREWEFTEEQAKSVAVIRIVVTEWTCKEHS
jgi:nitroimidazol reductase NimA-like FMN-containing flavoprotein (pyridoxamine 5'-phosphate oxidase superfamily)